MYPKWTFPEKSRKVPKRRKKRMGPARSESSIMCWSMRARGLSTVSVYYRISALYDLSFISLRKEPGFDIAAFGAPLIFLWAGSGA